MSTELSTDLARCESIIDHGLKTFIEVGSALLEIREGRLYGDSHATFPDYCQARFGFSKRRANQLISATQTVDALGTRVPTQSLPRNEMQVRTLAQVASTPQEQAQVWTAAVEASPKTVDDPPQVSSSLIKRVAAQSAQESTSAESLAIDLAIARLTSTLERIPQIADELRSAMRVKAACRGGFENRLVGYLKKVDALMGWFSQEELTSAVGKLSSEWSATKQQVDS